MEQPSKQGALTSLRLPKYPTPGHATELGKMKKTELPKTHFSPRLSELWKSEFHQNPIPESQAPAHRTLTRVPKSLPASKCVTPNRNPNPTPVATKLNKSGAPKTKVTLTMQIPWNPNTRSSSPCTQTPIRAPKSQTALAQTQTQTQLLLQSNWINLKLPKLKTLRTCKLHQKPNTRISSPWK